MKTLYTALSFSMLFMLQTLSAQDVAPVLANGKYTFTLGDVSFEVNPSKGGRITSLKFKSIEYMWVDPYTAANMYGSTYWPSPQSRWDWPPSTTLDGNPYTVTLSGNTLSMLSGQDYSTGTTGLQVRKTFYMNAVDTSITIIYTLKNVNATTNSWAGWEVTRVPAGGLTFYPSGLTAVTEPLSSKVQKLINTSWYKYASSDPGDNKFMQDGAEGWLAHLNNNKVLLIKKFDDVPSTQQAPGEAEIDIYLSKPHYYIELENQGIYKSISKGDSVVYEVKWYLRSVPTTMNTNVGSQELVDYVKNIINPATQSIAKSDIEKTSFSVYPNPATNQLIIKNEKLIVEKPIITNTLGQHLNYSSFLIDNSSLQIDISQFPSGLYFIRIGNQTSKFIKQ